VFVLFALVQAAPHSHALSGQRHKVAPSWSFASDFPGLDARFSLTAWTSDTSLMLHFQGSLCTVVAIHSLRSLGSAELYVFITQRLPGCVASSRALPSRLLGRIIASPAEPCSTVWVVAQMTMLKYWSLVRDTVILPAAVGHDLHQVCALYI